MNAVSKHVLLFLFLRAFTVTASGVPTPEGVEGLDRFMRFQLTSSCAFMIAERLRKTVAFWPSYLSLEKISRSPLSKLSNKTVFVKNEKIWGLQISAEELFEHGEKLLNDLAELELLGVDEIRRPQQIARALQHPLVQKMKYLYLKPEGKLVDPDIRRSLQRHVELISEELDKASVSLPHLTELHIDYCFLSAEILDKILADTPDLRKLSAVQNNLLYNNGMGLDQWDNGHLKNLTSVKLEGTFARYIDIMPMLKQLELHGATARELSNIFSSPATPPLEELYLVDGAINEPEPFNLLTESPVARSLKKIHLNSYFSPEALDAFLQLPFDNLDNLIFDEARSLDDEKAAVLANGRPFPALKRLTISNVGVFRGVEEAGLISLGSSRAFPVLEKFRLHLPKLTPAGIHGLLETPGSFPALKSLYVPRSATHPNRPQFASCFKGPRTKQLRIKLEN